MLQSQGLLHDTYFYGVDVKTSFQPLIHPTEVMDGAIVSGNCVSACDKNTTIITRTVRSSMIYWPAMVRISVLWDL